MNIVRQVEPGEGAGGYKTVWRHLPGFLPTPGNILFTLLIAAVLFWVQTGGAFQANVLLPGSSTDTIAYQGRLADANGNPLSGTFNMTFKLYNVPSSGSVLWTESWTAGNAVNVSTGLFNSYLAASPLFHKA
jgi:hypothetical protein